MVSYSDDIAMIYVRNSLMKLYCVAYYVAIMPYSKRKSTYLFDVLAST